jgi:hypothetical protein
MIKKVSGKATMELSKELFAERGKLLQTIRDFVECCA